MPVKEKFVNLNFFLYIWMIPFMKGLEYKHRTQTKKISIRIYDKKKSREITKQIIRRKNTIWKIKPGQLTVRRK